MLREIRQIGLRPEEVPDMPELVRVAEMEAEMERQQSAGMKTFKVRLRETCGKKVRGEFGIRLRKERMQK